jgi:hypothetical protein
MPRKSAAATSDNMSCGIEGYNSSSTP